MVILRYVFHHSIEAWLQRSARLWHVEAQAGVFSQKTLAQWLCYIPRQT